MRVRYWLAFVLAARGASAAAAAPAGAPAPPRMSVCECVKNKRCWPVAKMAFATIVSAKKTEVEGALPGRFFPGTRTATLERADKDGHFLRVTCGPDWAPCASYRDVLEHRLAVSTLAQSVSGVPEDELFSPKTWELTSVGEKAVQDAKRCRPGIWAELAPFLTGGSPFD